MMKTRTGEEPVEHAFTGGLLGLVAFVVLDVCWFVMNHGVGPMSIASRLLGPPIFAFGGALLFSLAAPVLKRLRLDPAPVSTTVAPFVYDARFAPSLDARDARWTRRSQGQARSGAAGGVWQPGGFPGQTSVPALQPGFVASFLG